jgi:hypothetical protein
MRGKTKRRIRNFFILAVIGAIAVAAFLTNPGQEKHKEAVRNKFDTYMQKTLKDGLSGANNDWGKAGQIIGGAVSGAIVAQLTDQVVSVGNYYLFSTTKITWNGQTNVVGIGAFGNVFLSGKIDDALKKGTLPITNK